MSAKSVDGGSRPVAQPKAERSESPQRVEKSQKPERSEQPDAGSEVRASRNKDSFEASRAKPKVDLNPSAPPARADANANAAAKPEQKQDPKQDEAADAARKQQIDAELAKTETGRQAQKTIERTGAQVAFEDGDRSYFDPSNNRVVLGRNQSATDASSALVNESVHAAAWADGTSPDPAKVSKDQYVDGMVREEAQSSALEIEHRRELAAQGAPTGSEATALDKGYDDAYQKAVASGLSADAAKEAGRAAVLQGVQNGDAVAQVSGGKYGDYYANQYDRVASGEISAAGVVRSNDDTKPVNHPERIGAVLHAEQGLPAVDKLSEAGVRAVRITVTAKSLQSPTSGSQIDATKLEEMRKTVQSYHDANPPIEVTLNLPPELVDGKPEFARAGQGSTHMKGAELVEEGDVTDIPGNEGQWETYKTAHLARAEQLADKLGPFVDNWEVGNEPDATEKRYRNDAGQATHVVYDQDNQPHTVTGAFDPGFPAARYGELLNAEYEKIKGKDPSSKVLTAGLVAGDAEHTLNGAEDGKVSYLENAWNANGGLRFDGIAVHPYGKRSAADFQFLVDKYQEMGAQISSTPQNPAGTKFPIYVTEASYGPGNPNDPETRDNYLKYMNDIAHATDDSPNVAATYFFWNATNDDHPGVNNVEGGLDRMKRLQGKQ